MNSVFVHDQPTSGGAEGGGGGAAAAAAAALPPPHSSCYVGNLHPANTQQQNLQQPSHQQPIRTPTPPSVAGTVAGGGLLYNNLIPGHYRYGAKPPAPPPGPLLYSQQQEQQQQQRPCEGTGGPNHHHSRDGGGWTKQGLSHCSTVPPPMPPPSMMREKNGFFEVKVVQISEPDDDDYSLTDAGSDDDDNMSVVAIPSEISAVDDGQRGRVDVDDNDDDDDDEQYYRPFRNCFDVNNSGGGREGGGDNLKTMKKNEKKSNEKNCVTEGGGEMVKQIQPVNLLAMILLDNNIRGGGACDNVMANSSRDDNGGGGDVASLIRDASAQSQKARFMMNSLATKKRFKQHGCNYNNAVHNFDGRKNKSSKVGKPGVGGATGGSNANYDDNNDDQLYAAASAIHAEAAQSYRRVYCTLLGLPMPSKTSSPASSTSMQGEYEVDATLSGVAFGKWRSRGKLLDGLGIGNNHNDNKNYDSTSLELAKSMLMLSDMHARTAKTLCTMGVKWNIYSTPSTNLVQGGGDAISNSKDITNVTNDVAAVTATSTTTVHVASKSQKDIVSHVAAASSSSKTIANNQLNTSSSSHRNYVSSEEDVDSKTLPVAQHHHERLRLAVRKALDTANHEEDITNSTFLGRLVGGGGAHHRSLTASSSSMGNVTRSKNKVLAVVAAASSSSVAGIRERGGNGVNPIDDLMKLEKELQIMETKLEMGNSVANLGGGSGAGGGYRPDGSFCVIPPGSSYMSSSSMWTSGILLPGIQQHQQQHRWQQTRSTSNIHSNVQQHQQRIVVVRSRANHLQHFLGDGSHAKVVAAPTATKTTPTPPAQRKHHGKLQCVSLCNNTTLDQSWWGVGGHGSKMTPFVNLSSTAIASSPQPHSDMQHPPPGDLKTHPNDADANETEPRPVPSTSINAKQLMQLMDSLNRLGNENTQLMRMVEDAKGARAEAQAAREIMHKFKDEYGQRFEKVKEVLKKFNISNGCYYVGGGGGDDGNPVVNSAFMKSAAIIEVQKRDQMIKQLSNDLKKEREECKRKDSALQKYEAFYREVKARSAEKARHRQQLLEKEQQKQQEKNLP